MVCPKCGAENKKRNIFCSECGYCLDEEKINGTAQTGISQSDVNDNRTYIVTETNRPKKRNMFPTLAVAIGIIILLAVAAVFIVKLLGGGASVSNEERNQIEEIVSEFVNEYSDKYNVKLTDDNSEFEDDRKIYYAYYTKENANYSDSSTYAYVSADYELMEIQYVSVSSDEESVLWSAVEYMSEYFGVESDLNSTIAKLIEDTGNSTTILDEVTYSAYSDEITFQFCSDTVDYTKITLKNDDASISNVSLSSYNENYEDVMEQQLEEWISYFGLELKESYSEIIEKDGVYCGEAYVSGYVNSESEYGYLDIIFY